MLKKLTFQLISMKINDKNGTGKRFFQFWCTLLIHCYFLFYDLVTQTNCKHCRGLMVMDEVPLPDSPLSEWLPIDLHYEKFQWHSMIVKARELPFLCIEDNIFFPNYFWIWSWYFMIFHAFQGFFSTKIIFLITLVFTVFILCKEQVLFFQI